MTDMCKELPLRSLPGYWLAGCCRGAAAPRDMARPPSAPPPRARIPPAAACPLAQARSAAGTNGRADVHLIHLPMLGGQLAGGAAGEWLVSFTLPLEFGDFVLLGV
jgi:hypothetical protein